VIAIRGEFPECREIIVLTTYYRRLLMVLRALKAGAARLFIEKSLCIGNSWRPFGPFHAGKKSLSPEASFELAEHATDRPPYSSRKYKSCGLSQPGMQTKQIADQLSITGGDGSRVEGQEHSLQVTRNDSNSRRERLV